jgi:transglutaminase-like putative cysteine protease
MNSRSLSTLAIVGFLLLGGILFGLRYRSIRRDAIARDETRWELTYATEFEAAISQGQEAIVNLALPNDTRYAEVIKGRESWIVKDPNLRADETRRFRETGNRFLVLTTRQAGSGPYDATAKFDLLLSPRPEFRRQPVLENLTPDARSIFLRHEPNVPKDDPIVRNAAQRIPDEGGETSAEQLQWIFRFCSQDIDSSVDAAGESPTDDVKLALTSGRGSAKARARTMVALCRAQRMPARLVTGFHVQQSASAQPHVWVEVYSEQDQAWVPFDPTAGWSLNLPMNYVPARRNADEIVDATNVTGLKTTYSIRRLDPDPRILQAETEHPNQILNLKRMPVPMHTVLKILLLLPFAALITAVLRNVVGLQTFGTFSPALLAMSFIYADWRTGLMILVVVVSIGLFGRGFLERLRLLTVPRLSIILTMVILCVVFGVSTLYYFFGPTIGAETVLLPMVIITMLIERFHVSVEEDGMMFTLQLLAGTVLVAIFCFLVLGWERVGDFVLTYPETHFFTIAAFIVLGRYAGYRLTELWRFRDLVEQGETV